MLYRHIEVRYRLRLHALRSIHHKHGTFTGRYRTTDFITEVHVSRSIDQVEGIPLMIHLDGMALNRNTTFLLQVHVVEHLILHIPNIHRSGELQHTIGQGTFPVVYVRNNTKITYLIHIRLQRYTFFCTYKNFFVILRKI